MFKLNYSDFGNGTCEIEIGFIEFDKTNPEIVAFVKAAIDDLFDNEIVGGIVLNINGPASLPVTAQIIARFHNRFEQVRVYDPKMNGYVVSVATGSDSVNVGDFFPHNQGEQ